MFDQDFQILVLLIVCQVNLHISILVAKFYRIWNCIDEDLAYPNFIPYQVFGNIRQIEKLDLESLFLCFDLKDP